MRIKRQQTQSSLLLVLTALIWGVAFVAQSVGMDYVEPMTFNSIRFLLGAVIVAPWALTAASRCESWKQTIIGGICCGLILCISSLLQQLGIRETTVGKAGFITSLYIVMVPLVGVFVGKKAAFNVWLGVLFAIGGMYLLCMSEGLSISRGDVYLFFSAIGFTAHILTIDFYSPRTDSIVLSFVQFLVSGLVLGIGMLIWEQPKWELIYAAKMPILYAGIMSCGVGYTLQVIGQKNLNPVVASLIFSLESVFSLLAGWILLKQTLSTRELIGCAMVFAAVILAQLPHRGTNRAADHLTA